jgi:hypothetical protein
MSPAVDARGMEVLPAPTPTERSVIRVVQGFGADGAFAFYWFPIVLETTFEQLRVRAQKILVNGVLTLVVAYSEADHAATETATL